MSEIRITIVDHAPDSYLNLKKNVRIIEYSGLFPGHRVQRGILNIYTKSTAKSQAREIVKHQSVKTAHNELNKGDTLKLKLMQNMKYKESKYQQ